MPIHSTWGDWLPRTIAKADPEGVAVWYLGCNGVVLKADDGTTLFVDPYLGTGDPPRTVRMLPIPFDPDDVEEAHAVLATHEHTDHVHGPSQGPILANTDATFFAPGASLDVVRRGGWTDEWAIEDFQLAPVEPGDSIHVGSFTVSVEPAHDPDADEPVSYLFEHRAGTVFHGGDTKPHADLEAIGTRYDIDLGVVAFGSVGMLPAKETGEETRTRWYADENGVIEVANALRLERVLPSHWDMWRGLTADPSALVHHARSFPYPRRIDVVTVGDRLDLP